MTIPYTCYTGDMDKLLLEMLEKLNLTALESEVYLSALLSEKGSAYDISKTLKTRSSVYGTLEKLKRKGMITESVRKNKKVYLAKDLRNFIEEKRHENDIICKNILLLAPHLLATKNTSIKIFKGEGELVHGLQYGINNNVNKNIVRKIFAIYPSSSKVTISPKDTIYYNFNSIIYKKNYKKIIISDEKVRSEYAKLDQSFGFERHMLKHPIFSDISKLAVGVELLEDEGIIKIFFYKENLILVIENKEITDFGIHYLKSLIS